MWGNMGLQKGLQPSWGLASEGGLRSGSWRVGSCRLLSILNGVGSWETSFRGDSFKVPYMGLSGNTSTNRGLH